MQTVTSLYFYFVSTLILLWLESSLSKGQFAGIRLAGGDKPNAGRVEIYGQYGWGAICSDNDSWDRRDARVVCRQLGYNDVILAQEVFEGYYGYSTGMSYITDVMCNGDEDDLFMCAYRSYSDHACFYEAAVFCESPGYVGCFNAHRLLSNEVIDKDDLTPESCLLFCKGKHYKYASVQYNHCHCSNGGSGITEAPSTFCNLPCPENLYQICGGIRSYSVYDTTLGFCKDPGTPVGGSSHYDTFYFGGMVIFSCHDPPWLRGPEAIQCIIGDNPNEVVWSGNIPQCTDTPLESTTSKLVMSTTTQATALSTLPYEDSSVTYANASQRGNGRLGWIVLIPLFTVVLVIVVFMVWKNRSVPESIRLSRDKNANWPTRGNDIYTQDVTGCPSNIFKGVGQHDLTYNNQDRFIISTANEDSSIFNDKMENKMCGIHNGIGQHDLTYNDHDQFITSSINKEHSSLYAEIEDSQNTSKPSSDSYASVKETQSSNLCEGEDTDEGDVFYEGCNADKCQRFSKISAEKSQAKPE